MYEALLYDTAAHYQTTAGTCKDSPECAILRGPSSLAALAAKRRQQQWRITIPSTIGLIVASEEAEGEKGSGGVGDILEDTGGWQHTHIGPCSEA